MDVNNPAIKAKFTYNISNDEEEVAFLTYQKKYVFKGTVIKSIIFALLACVFLFQAITKPDYTLAWGLFGICLAFIAFIWYNPYKIRKNLLLALKEIEDDRYEFELFEDFFSIRTILPDNKTEEEALDENLNGEKAEEESNEIPPRLVYFYKEPVEVINHHKQFIIILKKQTIYTLPKRCMTDDEIKVLEDTFTEKINEFYFKIED